MKLLLQVILAAAITAALSFVLPGIENPIYASIALFIALLGFKILADLIPSEFAMPSSHSETGHVKWFNVSKGFGFITRKNGEDIFVHYRCIRSNGRGRRVLEDGQLVRFDIGEGEKGPQAENVRPVKA